MVNGDSRHAGGNGAGPTVYECRLTYEVTVRLPAADTRAAETAARQLVRDGLATVRTIDVDRVDDR